MESPSPRLIKRRMPPLPRAARIVAWVLGLPALLSLLLYAVMLITPIKLPFGSNAVQAIVASALPPSSTLELGDMALALESGVWPVVRFSPVLLTDAKSGARVNIGALEVGFSPVRALFGQPGATITVVAPHVQIVQDLLGPRVSSFDVVDDPDGGPPTVRVLEGADTFPSFDISTDGIDVSGQTPVSPGSKLRSDNDWLIYNLEAMEQGVAQIVEQATHGRFSKLVVRDGIVDTTDSVYGLFRRMEKVSLNIAPGTATGSATGSFAATLGGRTMFGSLERSLDPDGGARLEADVTNIDFSSVLPFLDDPESLLAVRGAGALSVDVRFAPGSGKPESGQFKVDLTGLDLWIKDDSFPIASSILDIDWSPKDARFTLGESTLQVGESRARLSGVFVMGLDKSFGPTLGIALHASNVAIQPPDLPAPEEPFTSVDFSGWSAPLYGAIGIDRLLAVKDDARIETTGRVDMLRAGLGLQLTIAGENVGADDLKRIWPSLTGSDSRNWFVANVPQGMVDSATLKFNFPVGTLGLDGEEKPIPKDSMTIDMVGTGVSVKPTPAMDAIAIEGKTRLQVRDSDVTISADGGSLQTENGPIKVGNAALIMDNSNPNESVVEVSGDIDATIPALVALAREQQPETLDALALPLDLKSLAGSVDVGMVTTIKLANETTGAPMKIDYVLNGSVDNFASSEPIQGRKIGNGQIRFSASQNGYQMAGTADVDGMNAEISVDGTPDSDPRFKLSSVIDTKDLAAFGFDGSEYISGQARWVAQPMPDGTIQVAVDLTNSALTIKDLAINKAVGVAGMLRAVVKMDGDVTELSDVDLAFDQTHLAGSLRYDAKKGLESADFTQFALSAGDSAQVSLSPTTGGYEVRIRGAQLDLKPMLQRFFGLGEGTGGVEATQFTQTLALDIKLDRALGSYATTAFNLSANMLLRGSDLRRASLTAQFGENNAVSITTNPTPEGRTMLVAFNDAGTILRLLGVYSQLAGGEGSLVLNTITDQKVQAGELQMRNFAIVDEANVAQILGNHQDSRTAISKQNRLDFNSGEVKFVRRSDRVEVSEAILSGATVGGTARGFIYTDQRQYDLTGTYVPLFGLNSAFQKIPLIGPLLGGREGEGLVGVTFAVTGPLDNPKFRINPLSALVPGAFRELFEFRAKEQPRAEE
ncbi:AsmA-like C-terminal domain-containing protein [Devosia rhodophyticola]|uniref:AsmA-like C-terminal domain-containing protein n=1 Tax=Devosia rhodophyticola TaxID=3026423 RepID=A0ABY7YY01_9HYPH|nr:AsmA-like C-terminal domain-containing protein [Devosia rhodophyticola]WDR05670.1 AsmA-like C-terminal domain-containing protein [Devosia rhodophyticola]